MNVLNALSCAQSACTLASTRYHPDPSGFMSAGVNQALAYINTHLTEPFSEADLAELTGQSPSSFSRSFRRHTGMALVQYVNRLADQFRLPPHSMSEAEMSITDICFAAGFNNISNFNRRFLDQKGHGALTLQNIAGTERKSGGGRVKQGGPGGETRQSGARKTGHENDPKGNTCPQVSSTSRPQACFGGCTAKHRAQHVGLRLHQQLSF